MSSEDSVDYPYAHLLPTFDNSIKYPPLTPFEHKDPARRALAKPNPRAFLDNATVAHLTPNFASEIHGLNLAQLDDDGRDQLALEVARRGLMVFRDQKDFIDRGPTFYKQWGSHFGRLHVHLSTAHPAGYPEFHLVHRYAGSTVTFEPDDSITTTIWHSDVSYELQPPGLTTFFLLAQPTTGGDTLYSSQVLALRSLSTPFVAFLRTLKAVHSGFEQANYYKSAKWGGVVRRDPVENVHPVVRKHPVTGEEALYVNKEYTRYIVGLKREESEFILNFLFDHIAKNADSQVRVKWQPYTVVVWDNRVTSHSAVLDYLDSGKRRHGLRITPQAERPLACDEVQE